MSSSISRIVITRRLPPDILAPLYKLTQNGGSQIIYHDSDEPLPYNTLKEYVSRSGGADALLCLLSDRIDKSLIQACEGNLKVIATMSVGVSHIDLDYAKEQSIKIGYTPNVLTDATADLVLALTLSVARRLPEASNAVRTGEWSTWKPFWMTGKDIGTSKIGIIGMGRIGEAITRRFKGFGCKEILYTGRSGAKANVDQELGTTYCDLPTLLCTADIIVTICALTNDTRNLLNYDTFSLMKSDAVFINASRGEVVNQNDLVRILQERPSMRAGLDVTSPEPLPLDSPLLTLPNCTVLPHIGSASEGCRKNMAEMTVENIVKGLMNESMPAQYLL